MIVTVSVAVTAEVLIVKLADDEPEAITTLAGTVATPVLLLLRVTVVLAVAVGAQSDGIGRACWRRRRATWARA